MNEEISPYPHFAVVIHFMDDDERELFEAEEDSDFEIIDIFEELEPAVKLADKYHRRYLDYGSIFTVELCLNPCLFSQVYLAGHSTQSLEELQQQANRSWENYFGLITKH